LQHPQLLLLVATSARLQANRTHPQSPQVAMTTKDAEISALQAQVAELQGQLAVSKKVSEVTDILERVESMAMQAATTHAKASSQTKESLERLESMAVTQATNVAKFDQKLTGRTENMEGMLMQAATNNAHFEQRIDGRTSAMEAMLIASAHQSAKMLSNIQKAMGVSENPQLTMDGEGAAPFKLEAIVRPNIWALKPYHCARDDYTEGVLLDANENAFGPPVSPNDLEYERYPCPYQQPLKTAVAAHRGVGWANVFVGVGSDEAIDMLMRIFCVPGEDAIIICPPTYGMYSVSAATNDVGVVEVPLTPEMDVALVDVLSAVTPQTKMIFLCSPGNPACKLIDKEAIVTLLESSYRGIVVIDEAYIDFAADIGAASCCELVAGGKYPNLVVLQTMSKAFGLAGIRCGFAIGSPELIAVMSKVKAPYNVNKLTSKIANEAYSNLAVVQQKIEAVQAEKVKLRAALEALSPAIVQRVMPSDTNFLMFAIDNASAVYLAMANDGVVVRDRSSCLHCNGCLRVTIGTPDDNAAFLASLKKHAAYWFPRPIKSTVQQYAWGLMQDSSLVHSLGACNAAQFQESAPASTSALGDPAKPFAEMWMGTHPNGPALVVDDTSGEHVALSAFLIDHPDLCGEKVVEAGGTAKTGGVVGGLPFLLKVLSVRTALSIQAHPHRELAAQLHAESPAVYKDPNHKPELIVALEDFVGMCAFRAATEVRGFLGSVPELRALVGEPVAEAYEASCDADPEGALEKLFSTLMHSSAEAVQTQLNVFKARLQVSIFQPLARSWRLLICCSLGPPR
jgi:histidinol-phosphate aminotransferase